MEVKYGEVFKVNRSWYVKVKNGGCSACVAHSKGFFDKGMCRALPCCLSMFSAFVKVPRRYKLQPGEVPLYDVVVPTLEDVENVAGYYGLSMSTKRESCIIPCGLIDGLHAELRVISKQAKGEL